MTTERLCRLRGRSLNSLADVYAALAQQLGFPQWFDPNLDALWDVLTTEIPGPVRIRWEDARRSKKRLGEDYQRLRALLKRLARERDDFVLELDEARKAD